MTLTTKRNLSFAGAGLAAVATVATFFALSTGVTRVAPGEDLQAALNAAQCGAVIEIEAGVRYRNITLDKQCTDAITIQSSRAGELPEGQRVTPAQSPLLAKLQSAINAEPVIKTAAGARGYKFIGVEISTTDASVVVYDLVRFGEGRQTQATFDSVPRGFSIDRSWIHGFDSQDVQRGVSMNCADCGVTNSTINEIHGVGFDTQAVCAWNTPGPLRVINDQLEASGENILIGGADPASAEMIPSDIQIRRNDVLKPLSWKAGDPSYAGKHWTVKNLLELKNAKNVTIDGNTFTNNWTDGQTGIPILFTVRNQEGTAPYSVISNVSFTNSIVRNAQGGINFLGSDNEKPSQRAQTALVTNNVFDKITGPFITINGYPDVTVEHNTDLQICVEGCNTTVFYGEPSPRFIGRNNVIQERPYGMYGDGGLIGKAALDKWAPDGVWIDNLVATPYEARIDGNQYVEVLTITADYRTPYVGKGADIDKLLAAQASVAVSIPTPQPSPSITPSSTPTPSPIGMPSGSKVEVISGVNVREAATINSTIKTQAQPGWTGVTTGASEKDPDSVNVFAPVSFSNGVSGYCAVQFLKVITEPVPSPTPTPVPSPTPTPSPTPAPASPPRVLLWPSTESGQTALWLAQAKEGYRANRHVPRPANLPRGNYVEFVKF